MGSIGSKASKIREKEFTILEKAKVNKERVRRIRARLDSLFSRCEVRDGSTMEAQPPINPNVLDEIAGILMETDIALDAMLSFMEREVFSKLE